MSPRHRIVVVAHRSSHPAEPDGRAPGLRGLLARIAVLAAFVGSMVAALLVGSILAVVVAALVLLLVGAVIARAAWRALLRGRD